MTTQTLCRISARGRIVARYEPELSAKRPWSVTLDGKEVTSAAGKTSRFADERAATKRARTLMADADTDAALKAKYANEPSDSEPAKTLGAALRAYGFR